METKLKWINLKNKEKDLPDLYTIMIVREQKMTTVVFRTMEPAIHVFNKQEFMVAGEVVPRSEVVAYAHYDLRELDKI